MKAFFKPNITRTGRLIRAVLAACLLAGGFFAIERSLWLAVLLFASGAFVSFEALRGWCVMRACGIKTKY